MPWKRSPDERRRDNRTYGTAWRKARRAQLERDRYQCQVRLDGCTRRATEVDHIIGADRDPQHRQLRSVCHACHLKITATQGGGARSPGSVADPEPRPRTSW